MSYTMQIPQVTAATIAPNPVSIRGAVKLSVTVTEIQVILQPETRYAGEIYAGEE